MDMLSYFSAKHEENELFESRIKLKKNELSK